MIQYTCPKCGADVVTICLDSYPPQYKTECTKCDWSHYEMEEIQRVSFPINDVKIINPVKIIPIQDSSYIPDPCVNCSNHPSNGGSGICHCTLGGIKIT